MNDFNLEQHNKLKTGFSVPKDYFEDLEKSILKATLPTKKSEVIVMKSTKIRWISGIAASILLLFSLYTVIQNSNTTEEIDVATLENYLSYQPDLMHYQLILLLEEEDIQNLEVDLNLEQEDLENYLETKNIEKYLID